MGKATQALMAEHRVIQRVLDALEVTLEETGETDELPVDYLRDIVRFSQSFIDACHHGKEEGCLFPCLERRGLPREDGPIAMMLEEHEIGRGLVRQIGAALDGYEQGTVTREEAIEPCRAYIELLRGHIEKEDSVLFEMSEAVMSEADDADTAGCYEQAEHADHDELMRLAERLEQRTRD